MFPGSACEYNCYLPSTVGHLIIADFLFPEASGSIHSSQLQRTDLTHPYALAFILKPCLPLSWRPLSVPGEHICSDFGHPLASWLHPRNPPALEVEVGVPPAPAVFPRQLQSQMGGRLSRAFSLVTSSPDGTGAIWKAKTLSLEERRRQPPPHFRHWEMLPTHSTPPLDSCPQSGSGLEGVRMVRPAWEMWSGSASEVLTRRPPPPLPPASCRESSASSEKVHTPHKSF